MGPSALRYLGTEADDAVALRFYLRGAGHRQMLCCRLRRGARRLAVWIDSGYIPRSQISGWRELLRNAFINVTLDRPIVHLDTWPTDHPFLQRFVEGPRGTGLVLKPAFKEMIEFRESSSSVAVRIADVVASIIRRSKLLEKPLDAYALLKAHCLHPESFTLIEWTQDRPLQRPNPYLV